MYQFIKQLNLREALLHVLPTLTLSLVFTELFYKFGSFSAEFVAFLATWYVVDFLISKVRIKKKKSL